MDVNQIKSQFEGYRGWNDPAAILADFKATGGAGKGGPVGQPSGATSGALGDVTSTARDILGFQREAVQPAVQTLQAQESPLKARYSAVLESLKGREQQAVSTAQTAAAREFGQRGIPLSSGMYQQYLQQKTLPISAQFGGLQAETSLAEQKDLMDLASRIAQLQGGDASNALDMASKLISARKGADVGAEQIAYERAQKEREYQEITYPQAQATLQVLRSRLGGNGLVGNNDPFGLRD